MIAATQSEDDGRAFAAAVAARISRLQAHERQRLRQAQAVLPLSARRVLDLLPLLLHCHHPRLPGYRRGDVPHGIDGFSPDSEWQRSFLHRLGIDHPPQPQPCSILGLYAMGSTASIGQGAHSDFDVWVCVSRDLQPAALRLLEDKCSFLSVYAGARGVDLKLFVTPENRFELGRHGDLGQDDCGSAQNLFLLDEFYRTSLRLAGRRLLWYLVPTADENADYEGCCRRILALPGIDPRQWFDLGSVLRSSPTEYFGSGLWLMYKGIDAPFKAVLKILLMEVYANSYPGTRLLSSELKDRLLAGEQDPLQLDPYCAMFRRVAEYLALSHDELRLDLVRKCFYFKIFYGLPGLASPEACQLRRRLLQDFAASCGWSSDEVRLAEGRERWGVNIVRSLNRKLLRALTHSYRALLLFSIRHGIEYAITSDDVGCLSRRLYAAYDHYPGKILVFNPELRSYLSEPCLTFVHPHPGSLCRQEWHLYACASDDLSILGMPLSYAGQSLGEVVAWACFNNLLHPRTRIDVAGASGIISSGRIRMLASDLMRLMLPHLGTAEAQVTQQPMGLRHGMVILNLEHDPTRSRRWRYGLELGSSLSAGRQRICLAGSITLIMITSWGELVAVPLADGEAGIVDLLAMLVKMTERLPGGDPLHCIQVCSYAAEFGDRLRFDLEALINKVFMHQDRRQDFTFEIGGNSYRARDTGERGIVITRQNAFGQGDYDISILSRYGMRPEFSLQVPSPVGRYATIGIIQYFFAPAEKGWDIYILNERNEVRIRQAFRGSRAALVNSINRFYTSRDDDPARRAPHFNLPQYFVLSPDLRSITPFTIRASTA